MREKALQQQEEEIGVVFQEENHFCFGLIVKMAKYEASVLNAISTINTWKS